jgi:hypothetical protein
MKKCSRCKTEKELTEFNKDNSAADGLRSYCQTCGKEYWSHYRAAHRLSLNATQLARQRADPQKYRNTVRKSELNCKYGLTPEGYEALLAAQGGVCAICEQQCISGMRLAVDHVHGANPPIIRGLLCCNCNRAVGLFQDLPENCDKAAAYLRRTISLPR